MKVVTLISAFGRGESLALALQAQGFQVRVLDFTAAMPAEAHRGVGPFPVVPQAPLPTHQDLINQLVPFKAGLNFWLKGGPVELTGPMATAHASTEAVQGWRTGALHGDFSRVWISRFLRQWSAPYYFENWAVNPDPPFPADLPLALFPEVAEAQVQSFGRAWASGLEVILGQAVNEVVTRHTRITSIEVEAGRTMNIESDAWVWCLSTFETGFLGASAQAVIFKRGLTRGPSWQWLRMAVHTLAGPWSSAWPGHTVVFGDTHLPWMAANMFVLRMGQNNKGHIWMRVPSGRIESADSRRMWASEAQLLLNEKLALADWRIDAADWNYCAMAEIHANEAREMRPPSWKQWAWLAPEVLPRLDLNAWWEREGKIYNQILKWREEYMRKNKGVRVDQPLHAP